MSGLSLADVDAGVRRAIGAYCQALDDGRTDDVVACFCPDGAMTVPDMGTQEGHDALHAWFAGLVPRRPQRHLVLNTHVVRWDEREAQAVSDMVFLLLGGDGGWKVQLVGRYDDVLHRGDDGVWRFNRRAITFVTAG